MIMPNTVQAPTNPVNEAHKQYNQSRTQFPMTYLHYTTENYGLLNPFFAMEGVPGDTIPLESKHEVRAHTFKAPLMSSISKNKDYYNVPMRAILPRTWELIYANPTQGDDIPEDSNCCLDLYPIFSNFKFNWNNTVNTLLTTKISSSIFKSILRYLIYCEMFLSDGSLLAKMGYRFSPLFRYESQDRKSFSFDSWLDLKLPEFLRLVNPIIEIDGERYFLDLGSETLQVSGTRISMSRFMELVRDYPDFTVASINSTEDVFGSALFDSATSFSVLIPGPESEKCVVNIGRAIAYQLVSYHFYSNDKVDPIYSAQLYRGLMQSLAGGIFNASGDSDSLSINSVRKYFTYNGELLEYDLFSEAVLSNILNSGVIASSTDGLGFFPNSSSPHFLKYDSFVGFMRNLLGFNRSLRYGDYFTGARPFPLAVGDVNATVVSGQVNAVDMTRSLLMQRFLNAVNRVGRKFAPYVQLLSGRTPAPDPTNPQFLSHDVSSVGSFEVENTAENQGKIVTIARSTDSRYAFSYDVNEPCIVIGLSWYEVQRVYTKTIDRHAFHRTRFDMFNKFFQYQGDQAIFRKELNAGWLVSPSANFAYTLRYMEYKQRPSIATGGFVEHLPGYAFITDNQEAGFQIFDQDFDYRISPEFIRAQQAEFDRFYSSLTGVSLSGYFHFIVKYINICEPQRQMEYAPSVL